MLCRCLVGKVCEEKQVKELVIGGVRISTKFFFFFVPGGGGCTLSKPRFFSDSDSHDLGICDPWGNSSKWRELKEVMKQVDFSPMWQL